jgi:NADH-quinone oxidoreductase subunit G
VGSLLSKDSLHKARAWELDKAASICTGCSQGCNINLDTRSGVVVRIRPRTNLDLNQYYICDHGRLNYRWMNRGDRIEAPLVRDGKELAATDWDHALGRVAQILRGAGGKAVVLVSPNTSNEALFLVKTLLAGFEFDGVFRVERKGEEEPLAGVPNLALRCERAANVKGATLLDYREDSAAGFESVWEAAVVLVLDEGLEDVAPDALTGAGSVIYMGSALPLAARNSDVVLPITNVAEEDGTFVNRDGRVQRYFQAKSGPGMARPAWWVLSELIAAVGEGEALMSAAEAFDKLVAAEPAFAGMSYASLGYRGALLRGGEPAGVTT